MAQRMGTFLPLCGYLSWHEGQWDVSPGQTDLLRWEAGAFTPTFWVFADRSPGGQTGIPAVVSLRDAVAHLSPCAPRCCHPPSL